MASGDPTYSKIVETLLQLYRSAKSGVVRLERSSMKKQLALCGGAVAFAESSMAEDHLARVLVRQGLVAEKALRKISSLIKARRPSDEAIME
ncbi:MAG: hypothetical protein FJW35_14825, partial [Acidobacteria bacterium]|nr:hypothetical protein [Acidobacteriota bacterium]